MGDPRDDVMYKVIFLDHDGTWTWSVESGKAFEPNHRIHARGDGCATQGVARRKAEEAMTELARGGD